MNILGISCFYHDSAACLVEDGEIVAAAQEERFTRKKHDHDFPQNAIDFCLSFKNLKIDDIDYVAFYEKPFIKFERILETYLAYAPLGIRSFIKAMPLWIKRKLWIPDIIKKQLGYTGIIIYPEHHESHAASAFFPSPFERAAFLTMDGVGEWTTTSFGVGEGNRVTIDSEIHFPHSIGLLYSAFTYFTGFRVNSGEYKVMGLAPYGEPRYVQTILDHLIDLKEDGSFKLNMDYFNYGSGLTMTSSKFNELFGDKPRKPESALRPLDMDMARSVQEVVEEVMLRAARHVHRVTGQENLCLAGGVALNCVGNGRILREGLFKNIWIQPAAGDAGGSLGAALFTWYQFLDKQRSVQAAHDAQRGSYLGPYYDDSAIETFLEQNKIPYEKLSDEQLFDRTTDYIINEKVIGWFQDRMEFGPRALGNRSIIGDARSPEMQTLMNLKIKFRESFRPFAPSVLRERAADYFDIEVESPYMLLVAQVNDSKKRPIPDDDGKLQGIDKLRVIRSEIPAVTHVDYSARLQTVSEETNPRYHRLIKALEQKIACPVIINTSFNVRGEPIVCTPDDAYQCFMRTEMDYLILGNYLITKDHQSTIESIKDRSRVYELD
ncbi:carbamoyltransferase [candidate division KSB1 bacterium]|nr:carbamoyltransferase [candidate division KSB1 bacterium]